MPVGPGLALAIPEGAGPWVGWHRLLGWTVVALAALQFAGGWLRGSKGGPTAPAPDGSAHGDHYDMTPRRRAFEYVHRSVGYMALLAAFAAIPLGLWLANGPRWMWLRLLGWWIALAVAFAVLQRRGYARDTYQAIWGPDPRHRKSPHADRSKRDQIKATGRPAKLGRPTLAVNFQELCHTSFNKQSR